LAARFRWGAFWLAVISLEAQKLKDFVKRPEDVIRVPYQTASGEMFFEIDGHVLTVAQMLKLMDQNQLDRGGICQVSAKKKGRG
jgi:hypothetical protein